ncbi:MAG: glycosyltransferase family 4 protein [Gemmatimonadaceae bacterium]
MPLLTPQAKRSGTSRIDIPILTPHGLGGGAQHLRIALVTEYYYPHLGGVCEHVHYFAREARSRGHHVDIITSNIPGAELSPHVIRLGRSQPVYANGSQARITIGLGLRKQMRDVLRRGRYDIVHVHAPLTPVLPLLAVEEADCAVVGTFHTYFDKSVTYTIGRKYFQDRLNRLDAAIAVSDAAIAANERYFDADWIVIPNGIDVDAFSPDAPPPPDIRTDVPSILFLGRFDPRNGLATLIDAFKRVRGRKRQAQLVVVGGGPLAEHYLRMAGGDPDIKFVGKVLDGRPSYYAHSTMYACPTTKASFGITLLEAMACATPIVCSDIPGFRDVVQHGREALMVPCGDRDALASSLVKLLDDESLCRQLGDEGRVRSMAYSWPRVADTVLDVYARLLGYATVAA